MITQGICSFKGKRAVEVWWYDEYNIGHTGQPGLLRHDVCPDRNIRSCMTRAKQTILSTLLDALRERLINVMVSPIPLY